MVHRAQTDRGPQDPRSLRKLDSIISSEIKVFPFYLLFLHGPVEQGRLSASNLSNFSASHSAPPFLKESLHLGLFFILYIFAQIH